MEWLEVWPAILVTGVSFAVPQFLVSNYHGPFLVDVVAALVSIACLVAFLRVWQPKRIWTDPSLRGRKDDSAVDARGRPLRLHLRRGGDGQPHG